HTRTGDQLHAFTDQGIGIHDHQARITIRPDAAHVSSAFTRIAFAYRIVIGDLIFIILFGVLVALLRGLIFLQAVLIVLLLLLIPRIVGVRLGVRRGIGGGDLIVQGGGFGLFRRRGIGGGP